jgi:HEPN domain-containing protein
LNRARSDLAIAKNAEFGEVLYEDLSFHSQQAVEKAIKGILVYLNIDFQKTHNIGTLLDLFPPDFNLPDSVIASSAFTSYAADYRYPGDYTPISREDWLRSVEIAEKVVQWAEKTIENIKSKG